MSRSILLPLVLLVACASWACEQVPLTAPTESTLTVTVNRTDIPISGFAEVIAVVVESGGTPVHNGTTVTFSASFGTMDPPEAQTQGGKAVSRFIGTSSGAAKINAFSGGIKGTEVTVNVGTFAASAVQLRAEPTAVPPTGGAVQVVALVVDASGNTLPNTPVTFTTDFGSLSSNTSTTDGNGEARTQLSTTRESRVTATVGSKTATVTVALVIVPTVTVTGAATINVGVPANFTITPTVPAGGSPIREVVVDFGDGNTRSLGPITGANTVSHTFSNTGTFTVRATATDTAGYTGTGTFAANVGRVLPSVPITCPATATVGVPAAFTLTPPANPTIPIAGVTVDFGDGTSRSFAGITGTTSFTKTFGAAGGYTVTATVTDTAGQRGQSSCAVVVNQGAAPTVTLTHTSSPANAGVVESFTVSASGGTAPLNIRVTLQDGTVIYNGAGGSFVHTFATAGTAVLTATATDAANNTGTTQLIVIVNP